MGALRADISVRPFHHPVVVANLRGGLGNQLFQYACGFALAIDRGLPLNLSVDMLGMAATPRKPEIEDVFGLKVKYANRQTMARLLGLMRATPRARLLLEKPWLAWARGARFIAEEKIKDVVNISPISGAGVYLHGYWQSERFFKRHAGRLRQVLCFSRPLEGRNAVLASRIKARPSASLHVRRGDYITNAKARDAHGVCDADYYLEAISRLNKQIRGLRWFAFSDEPEWIDSVLRPNCPDLEVIRHNRGVDSSCDMHLMSLCSHHVIANSSFSWWGAWLNMSPDKTVIAPLQWVAGGRESPDVTPEAWIRL